jgi:hypothetical protein
VWIAVSRMPSSFGMILQSLVVADGISLGIDDL